MTTLGNYVSATWKRGLIAGSAAIVAAAMMTPGAEALSRWDFTTPGLMGFNEDTQSPQPGTDSGSGEHGHSDLAIGSNAFYRQDEQAGLVPDQMWCTQGSSTASFCNSGLNGPVWATAVVNAGTDNFGNTLLEEVTLQHAHDDGNVPYIAGIGVISSNNDGGNLDSIGPDEIIILELGEGENGEDGWSPVSIELGDVDANDSLIILIGSTANIDDAVEIFNGTIASSADFTLGEGFAGDTFQTDAERADANIGTLDLSGSGERGFFLFIQASGGDGVRIRALEGTLPEPGTLGLIGLGLVGLGLARRRKSRAA